MWEGSDSSIDDFSLERLFLFSSCLNPSRPLLQVYMSCCSLLSTMNVVTSLQNTPITTLFYDSNLDTLSTEIIEPALSKCSYFGCYGAYYGFYYYTFSELSCTSSAGEEMVTSLCLQYCELQFTMTVVVVVYLIP